MGFFLLRQAAFLAAGVLLTASCGRDSDQPEGPKGKPGRPISAAGPLEPADGPRERRAATGNPAVVWLGLDGLDWRLLDRLAAEGKLPNWKRLVSEGYTATLRAYMPVLSPPLWTTAATGVGPDVHRVLDFQEVDPKTGQKVPISGLSRAVPAVWNVASASNKKVGVVGWWATHPAEVVAGFFVTDHASPLLFEGLPLAGVAYPASLEAGVAQVVRRDGVVTDEEIGRFLRVPLEDIGRARASGAGMENPLVAMGRILASTRVYQRIARDLYDRHLPDLMAVYFLGTDEIGHVFAPYVPPKLECVSEADFARYSGAVDAYYAFVDRLLGQWMRRAEEDGATLLVHSDHGFKWGEDRTCERSSLNWSTAAYWHRLDGVFAAWGSRVRHSPERGKASIADIAPTVAALLGIPADRAEKGRAIRAAFRDVAEPARKDLFGGIEVRRVAAAALTEKQADEYAKKLRALGYLSGAEAAPLAPTGGERPGMTEGAWNNLGLYLRETTGDLAEAEKAFQQSLALRPAYHSPMFNLAVLYRTKGETGKAVEWLFRSLAAGHADPEGTIARWAAEYREKEKPAAAREVLERAVQQYPANEAFARELALARFKTKDCEGAYATLSRFDAGTADPNTLNALGLFQTCLGRRGEAERLFERSLAMKPDQPGVVESLRVVRGGAR